VTVTIEIPTLPVGRVRALALVANPNPSYEDLAGVVDSDPGLATALLRAANSAASAPVDRVRTSQGAMVRVGMREARRIIIGVALSGSFQRLHRSGIDSDEIWRHLIATAVVADATAWGDVRHSEAFFAGLLHDVGRLALATAEPGRYSRVVTLARRGQPTSEAERSVFGVDHIEWGASLAQHWGFPDEIVDAIADHHSGAEHSISWVVTRAREMAAALGIGDGVIRAEPPFPGGEAPMLPVIEDLGGQEAVLQRIAWYQGAMAVAA
jgi:putative nucleotidyltransferase with HDIG domain